jgi:transcriptional regulator GlxA family with amidase domain
MAKVTLSGVEMTHQKIRKPIEIGILIYPEAQLAAVHGLTDLFCVANRINSEKGGTPSHEITVSHWQQDKDGTAIKRAFASRSGRRHPLSALVLPPSLGDRSYGKSTSSLCRWIKARHTDGAVVCSVCAGAFLLAETGLLAGRTATTHWMHAEEFRQRFPEITVDADKLIIDDGDILTAGGGMAWIDLGLRLIEKLMGPSVMLATARFFLVDPAGRQQSFYASFSPRLHHGDVQVLKLQHWFHRNYSGSLTVSEMAARSGLGDRTFLRRFHRATGLNPNEYMQYWRINKAREALEFSTRSVEEIGMAVGYQDISAFRNLFKKIVGIPPSEYRFRFGLK